MKRFLWQGAICLDQNINWLTGVWADETFSARTYRHRGNGPVWYFIYRFVNGIFFWQSDHCRDAYLSEVQRKHLPKEYR